MSHRASRRNPVRHSTNRSLQPTSIHTDMQIGVIGWREGESRLYMRVGLAPVLALLGEAAASDSPRHDFGCGGFSLPWVASGWEDFGGWTFCDCANDVPWVGVIAAGLRLSTMARARANLLLPRFPRPLCLQCQTVHLQCQTVDLLLHFLLSLWTALRYSVSSCHCVLLFIAAASRS